MIKVLFLFFFITFSKTVRCQNLETDTTLKPYNKALIWRGFNHLWSYNHRINRIGCNVKMNEIKNASSNYYSATGLGSDSTYYTIFYSYVASRHLRFYEGEISLKLSGKETQLLSQSKEISIDLPNWLKKLKKYKSLINGFDLKSEEKSDLPILFDIQIEDPYLIDSNHLRMKINSNWVSNCRSAECSIMKNATHYELKISFLIIGFDDENAIAFDFFNKKSYAWTTDIAPPYEPVQKKLYGQPTKYENSLLGIKSFGFILNEEQWLQELRYEIELTDYDSKDGVGYSKTGMQFLGWKEGMKSKAVSKSKAVFAHKKPGWVSLHLNTSMIQFKEGIKIDSKKEGRMFWKGWNTSAEDIRTIDSKKIEIIK